jgi:methylated-DNA-[protein]-cysteine S-methyltransferase
MLATPVTGPTTWVQDTQFGPIAVTLGPRGIEHVALPIAADVGHHDAAFDPAPERPVGKATSATARRIVRQIDDYLAGRRTVLDAAIDLDAAELSDLQRHVLLTVRAEIPYGETATYGEVAELVGRPGAARAVGTAMARCPVPLFVPCHRVVAANGLGGYGGGAKGVALKRALLELEGRARPTG